MGCGLKSVICRNPDNSLEKSEEAEFAQGPLSILYRAVKNGTSVGAFSNRFYVFRCSLT